MHAKPQRNARPLPIDKSPEFIARQRALAACRFDHSVLTDRCAGKQPAQRRQMRQEIRNRATRHRQTGMRCIPIVKHAALPQNIQADQHFHMCHFTKFAGLDKPLNPPHGHIEKIVVILDQRRPFSLARPCNASSSSRLTVIGFSTITCAPASSASIDNRKCEVGGVVTCTTSGLSSSSMRRWSVNHRPIPCRSAAHSARAGQRSHTPATVTSGIVFRHSKC